MRIEYIYRYVYVPAPVAPGSVTTPSSVSENVRRLGGMIASTRDEERRRALEELRQTLQRVAAIANNIRSSGMKGALEAQAAAIMAKLDAGNPEGALVAAHDLLAFANESQGLVDEVRKNLTSLANPVGVRGKAAKLLQNIAEMAETMLAAATSPEALRSLVRLTDQAKDATRRLEGLQPGTLEYNLIVAELGGIMDELRLMAQTLDPKGAPGMAADAIMWQQEQGARVEEALQQLRGATRDAFALQKLDQLDAALAGVLRNGRGLGPEATEGLRASLDGFLKQAAQGDVEGAIEGAKAMAAAMGQASRLKEVLGGRLARLEESLAALADSPAGERLQGVLTKVRDALRRADSPEALMQLDQQLQAALEAASTLRAAGPAGRSVMHPAYRELLGVERALTPSGEGSDGAPKMARDDFSRSAGGASQGKPRAASAASPADAPPPQDSPAIGGLRRLAEGLAGGDAKLILQAADRASRLLARATTPLDHAALAAELVVASDAAARVMAGGEASSPAREVLRTAFR
ncbi:MAG: hypothetical protein VKS61_12225 [Candidatus Sericytochromatia bacterium]|nr:hypothetical protein [Candidatus Sericytochromatia bacterium]